MGGKVEMHVFPARVGMNREKSACWSSRVSVPRASGDEPTRGVYDLMETGVFPARVGMNRAPCRAGGGTVCVPRASGDEPPQIVGHAAVFKCSPREWG